MIKVSCYGQCIKIIIEYSAGRLDPGFYFDEFPCFMAGVLVDCCCSSVFSLITAMPLWFVVELPSCFSFLSEIRYDLFVFNYKSSVNLIADHIINFNSRFVKLKTVYSQISV